IADASVDGLLRMDQAFLRIGLVVERNDLDLLALNAAFRVHFVGKELEYLQADFADAGAASRQRIDIADLDCLLRYRRAAEHRQRKRRSHHQSTHVIPPGDLLFLGIVKVRTFGTAVIFSDPAIPIWDDCGPSLRKPQVPCPPTPKQAPRPNFLPPTSSS